MVKGDTIDKVRRIMMMIVKYRCSWDAFFQIVKGEGVKSLFKGGGANIIYAITSVNVLNVLGKK